MSKEQHKQPNKNSLLNVNNQHSAENHPFYPPYLRVESKQPMAARAHPIPHIFGVGQRSAQAHDPGASLRLVVACSGFLELVGDVAGAADHHFQRGALPAPAHQMHLVRHQKLHLMTKEEQSAR